MAEDDVPAWAFSSDASAARSGLTLGLMSPASTSHSMSPVSDARDSSTHSGALGRCASVARDGRGGVTKGGAELYASWSAIFRAVNSIMKKI